MKLFLSTHLLRIGTSGRGNFASLRIARTKHEFVSRDFSLVQKRLSFVDIPYAQRTVLRTGEKFGRIQWMPTAPVQTVSMTLGTSRICNILKTFVRKTHRFTIPCDYLGLSWTGDGQQMFTWIK